jgi:hypothetical protein
MSGYGVSEWGTSSFGGLSASLGVVNAFALTTHEVVVELSKPPLDVSGFITGDVSNPRSWLVTVPETGQILDVAGVAPYERPLRWVIRTLQRLPESTGVARVSITGRPIASALRDASHAIGIEPLFFDFAGVTEFSISTPQQRANTRSRGGRDLRNIPAPTVSDTSLGGTLSIVGGDYALMDGADLIKKLITRRLTTTPGEFFHLPNYGVGLAVKQPLPGGGIARLKKRIEQQVLLEPDIGSASVSISQSSSVLTITIRVVMSSTGSQVTVALNSPIGQESGSAFRPDGVPIPSGGT